MNAQDDAGPLYRRVQRALLEDIRVRGLTTGDRLWSENEISARFDVARSVARQALADLETRGMVERFRGRGTFLASLTPRDGLLSSARGLHADAAARGQTVTSLVLGHDVEPAQEDVALALRVDIGTPCAHLTRVRLSEGAPWTVVDSWIPAALVPGITAVDLTEVSLYDTLADTYGLLVTTASRSVEAAPAPEAIAARLEIPPGSPVLVLRSVGRDPSDRPIDTFTAWHRADRSRFVVEVSNPQAGGHVEPLPSPDRA